MNYEALIERDLDAIPAAARDYLRSHTAEELWVSVTRFAVLAYAPSQHAKRAVMACRAVLEVRDELADRWPDAIIACARYAAESRQPWSEPPILDPPEPSAGTVEELRDAMAQGDRLAGERWLAARLGDAETVLAEVATGDALLMLDTALALLPEMGERGRYALLRMPVWELVAEPPVEDLSLPDALSAAITAKGSPDAVQRVFVAAARASWNASRVSQEGAVRSELPPTANRQLPTEHRLQPYPLARDYAQTLIAHMVARRLPGADAATLLEAVHDNLEQGENFAAWSFA